MSEIYVCLCALSNPVQDASYYESLIPVFKRQGIVLELSQTLLEVCTPVKKAQVFNQHLRSNRYDWILDVSGGDLANLVLADLDYGAYATCKSIYAAFSDGTCIVNALAAMAGKRALLFPLWNQTSFLRTFRLLKTGRMDLEVHPMEGGYWPRHARVFGGNLRCLLKLAGTGRMPDMSNSFLLVEGNSGDWYRFESMMAHLVQTGAMKKVRGLIFGRFNGVESQFTSVEDMYKAMKVYCRTLLPAGCAYYCAPGIGHIADSEGVWISGGLPRTEQAPLTIDVHVDETTVRVREK